MEPSQNKVEKRSLEPDPGFDSYMYMNDSLTSGELPRHMNPSIVLMMQTSREAESLPQIFILGMWRDVGV